MSDDFDREMEDARREFRARGTLPGAGAIPPKEPRDKRSLRQRWRDEDEDREAQAWKTGREEDYRLYMLRYARLQHQMLKSIGWLLVIGFALIIWFSAT